MLCFLFVLFSDLNKQDFDRHYLEKDSFHSIIFTFEKDSFHFIIFTFVLKASPSVSDELSDNLSSCFSTTSQKSSKF